MLNLPAPVSEHTHGDKCLQRCSMALLQRACLSAHKTQTPNHVLLVSKLQNQLPEFPGIMGKNRKDCVGVEAGRGSTLSNIYVLQLYTLTTVKKDLLGKKRPLAHFVKILTALFLLTLMAQRSN